MVPFLAYFMAGPARKIHAHGSKDWNQARATTTTVIVTPALEVTCSSETTQVRWESFPLHHVASYRLVELALVLVYMGGLTHCSFTRRSWEGTDSTLWLLLLSVKTV